MNMADLEPGTREGLQGELRLAEPMHRHTSWKVGGIADRVYVPADLQDLGAFLRSLPPEEPVLAVGLGSNLLVRDGGFRGTVILLHRALNALALEARDPQQGLVYAEAGVASPKVARFAALHDLEGAEFLAGIPGTVGGALAMNAGCYGAETWEVVERVTTIDRAGRVRQRRPADYQIGYRHVALKARDEGAGEEWFVSACLRLNRGDGERSRQTIKRLLARRVATQPLNLPNAGSVFRNPPGDHAARLIEGCGLKGYRIGNAMVSDKHANFIVNLGGAKARDIETIIETVERTVAQQTGVGLVREVRVVGEPA
ncbi:UDP-N-acetylmuramate dehydrogenase [Pelomicrobium sp. G1]|uniref:UDP-N-acetylmuramate dehydrogenase n=1 Tax=unclassified Pelomicrobium TaxID=2815318 RepID=UPI003F76575B